jgi:hypothetical protein
MRQEIEVRVGRRRGKAGQVRSPSAVRFVSAVSAMNRKSKTIGLIEKQMHSESLFSLIKFELIFTSQSELPISEDSGELKSR